MLAVLSSFGLFTFRAANMNYEGTLRLCGAAVSRVEVFGCEKENCVL